MFLIVLAEVAELRDWKRNECDCGENGKSTTSHRTDINYCYCGEWIKISTCCGTGKHYRENINNDHPFDSKECLRKENSSWKSSSETSALETVEKERNKNDPMAPGKYTDNIIIGHNPQTESSYFEDTIKQAFQRYDIQFVKLSDDRKSLVVKGNLGGRGEISISHYFNLGFKDIKDVKDYLIKSNKTTLERSEILNNPNNLDNDNNLSQNQSTNHPIKHPLVIGGIVIGALVGLIVYFARNKNKKQNVQTR